MDISLLRERSRGGALSVTELNSYIKKLLDADKMISAVSVTGEISNLKDHGSGHLYFSVKDSGAQIKAVMFRSQRSRLKFIPADGMKVTIFGSVSLYEQTGSVQIYVNSMEPDGIGALYKAYEQLKEKLLAEGLFDEANKKPIPKYPRRIGVITSPSGAAVRDIINVTKRRFPLADVYLYPSLVQGDGAEANLIRALDFFEKSDLVDVIIIGRGGGSIEDLWAFNGERLARKIFELSIPIISAVGHETDFTICDFVSDMRAPTPSAAAEIAVPDVKDLFMRIDDMSERSATALIRIAERKRERLESIAYSAILRDSGKIFERKKESVSDIYTDAVALITHKLKDKRNELALFSEKADAMSPLSVLKRGYAVCEKEGGGIPSAKNVKAGEFIKITLSDGSLNATVNEVKVNEVKRNEENAKL